MEPVLEDDGQEAFKFGSWMMALVGQQQAGGRTEMASGHPPQREKTDHGDSGTDRGVK